MDEQERFVRFVGEAHDTYQNLKSLASVVGLWEQLSYIADDPDIDYETVFELATPDDILKIIYGPPFTLVFKNLLDGTLVVYQIRNPSF